jgi:two-component system, OmpR family, KDP operon response regulator KdpE
VFGRLTDPFSHTDTPEARVRYPHLSELDMNLLVADDDPLISHLLRTGLQARGWKVTIAADAMQAVMFAMRTPPDAVVLDINMPGGTGRTALQRLKASVKTSGVPVVVLSGVTQPSVVREMLALGAAAFLHKPADLDQLDATLREALGLTPT